MGDVHIWGLALDSVPTLWFLRFVSLGTDLPPPVLENLPAVVRASVFWWLLF